MKKLSIDVWSDIACPWCYVGKRRLEAALARFSQRAQVEITWRAFELDTEAPREREPSVSYPQRLADKYRTSVAQAETMIRRMTQTAAEDGLDFHFEKIRPGNTFDAHRVLHLAADRGKGDAAKERFLRAYMTEGEPIGDPETLVRLASEVGLDAGEVRTALAGDAYAREVRADEAEASALGIRGVPFFVIGGRYAVSGAQPAEVLLGAIAKAWDELPESEPVVATAEAPEASGTSGEACGPEGCG